jgi:hypothetical protein
MMVSQNVKISGFVILALRRFVILSPSPAVILALRRFVILSKAKDLVLWAQHKFHEGSRLWAQDKLREGSRFSTQGKLHKGSKKVTTMQFPIINSRFQN